MLPASPRLQTFDYTALANYFASGAALDRRLHAEVLRNGALKDSVQQAESGVVPPWQSDQPQADPADVNRFLKSAPLIDLEDPQVDQEGASDAFKNLFGLYKGLVLLRDLAEFARDESSSRTILERQFQRWLAEARDFADDTRFDGITLVAGLKEDTAAGSIKAPKSSPTDSVFSLPLNQSFQGPVIATVREDPIAGLTGSETFNIRVTTSTTTKDIPIDLSAIGGTLNIDNIVDHINGELLSQGVASSFKVERLHETAYAIGIDMGSGETLEFSTSSAAEAAVYVAGAYGTGPSADGFVAKFDDLGNTSPNEVFTEAIGTTAGDNGNGVAVDSEGNVYVVGSTAGDLDGQGVVGERDMFLNKYDAAGNLLFTVRLGATENAAGLAVAIDGDDNVVVAGHTLSPLTDSAFGGSYDTFVSKFDSEGKELFTRQAAPFAPDSGLDLTIDASGDIFVTGVTGGAIASDQTHLGGNDAFVTKLDGDGNLVYNKQFGTAGEDSANAVAVDDAGNVYVAANVNGDAVVRKYADSGAATTPTYEINLGALGSDGDITGIALDGSGGIYVTGFTTNASLSGPLVQAHSGGTDAFLSRIADAGASASVDFTTYVGTAGTDRAFAVAVNGADVYITGETEGSIDGATQQGSVDAFVAKLSDAGALTYAHQLGGGFEHRGTSIAFDAEGTTVLSRLGLPNGQVPPAVAGTVAMEMAVREGQSFFISVDGGVAKQITIESTDTLELLGARISNMLGTSGAAAAVSDGDLFGHLEITAKNGAVLEILAGPEGFNALPGLGLEPIRLIGSALNTDEQAELDLATFELGLTSDMNVLSKTAAGDAVTLLENAMREVRAAFRFLTEGPPPDDPFADVIGPPPPYLAKRIAAFEDALARLQPQQAAPSTSLLV